MRECCCLSTSIPLTKPLTEQVSCVQHWPDQICVILLNGNMPIQNKCDQHTLQKSRLKTNLSFLDMHVHTYIYKVCTYTHAYNQAEKMGLKRRIYEIKAYVCFLLINNNKYNTIWYDLVIKQVWNQCYKIVWNTQNRLIVCSKWSKMIANSCSLS